MTILKCKEINKTKMEKITNLVGKRYNYNNNEILIVKVGRFEADKDFFGNAYEVAHVTFGSSEDNFTYARYTDIEVKDGRAYLMAPGSETIILDEIEL